MKQFMERAVQLAIANVQEGGQPFGAVLVMDEQIIAEGVNELHVVHDVSGHAELLAIRRAQQQLQTNDLSGFTMYASGEPCAMCLSAMYFANIKDIYYCESVKQAAKVGLDKSKFIYNELKKDRAERTVSMQQIPLESEQQSPMKVWESK
ncbi:tRNA-specific adenosine deaminase [Solibacillus sp. R5-41]|uniref:nucleoside deaminase n=1 Tax=Solibacillus sp. R5-41 TaxID=2048654 RepID=UPI000C1252FB|nr:nucleoside deaminase [Solibacillus sp. R5-41]ATP40463.1 tRNA-specific adenosine deaminase [Solibacillus sp. R5-41]